MCWHAKFNTLFTGGDNGLLHTWDVASQNETRCMIGHTDSVTEIVALPEVDVLVSAGMDGLLCLWDTTNGALRQVRSFYLST
jgi:WD40 repeat protein